MAFAYKTRLYFAQKVLFQMVGRSVSRLTEKLIIEPAQPSWGLDWGWAWKQNTKILQNESYQSIWVNPKNLLKPKPSPKNGLIEPKKLKKNYPSKAKNQNVRNPNPNTKPTLNFNVQLQISTSNFNFKLELQTSPFKLWPKNFNLQTSNFNL